MFARGSLVGSKTYAESGTPEAREASLDMEISVPLVDINPEAMLAAKQCPHSVFTLEVVN
jgi:hypothetical protein